MSNVSPLYPTQEVDDFEPVEVVLTIDLDDESE